MGPGIINRIKNSIFHGNYVGRDLNVTNIIMFQDSEREFVVTHNANIKPVSYFTGRETELQELRQRIEGGRKSVLVSGMGGIGKTHICRKLFEEYKIKNGKGENKSFSHIGYIEYDGDMNRSLQECLRYKEQKNPELNKEAAWRELECLASDGKLLLFVDNVNVTVKDDPSLERLKQLPGAIVLTSRRTAFSNEFEQLRIGFLDKEQCKEIYEKIRFEDSGIGVKEEEVPDLEYIIEELTAKHTITMEHLAHLAKVNGWSVKNLRNQLERKGFQLEYVDDEEKLVNIQESYEVLYDLSELTEAEQNILEAFSVFPYIPLEKEICNQWLLADAGVSEEENVLFRLYRKGWLQFDIEQCSYALHPVFAQFIYEKCKPRMEKHIGLIEACEKCITQPIQSTFECWTFIPFAINLFGKMDFRKRIEYGRFTVQIAFWFEKIGEYEEAEKWYRRTYDIFKEMKGEYHSITLYACSALASIHEKLGGYENAEKEYNEILEAWRYVPIEKKDYAAIASTYKCLENMYINQERYDKAEGLFEKILNIKEHLLKEDQYGLAAQYHAYAERYDALKNYEKAEKFYKRCVAIRNALPGEMSLSRILSYYELGEVYMRHGRYQDAQNCFIEVNKIGTDEYGANILDVFETMRKIYTEESLNGNFEQWLKEKMKESD